MAYKPQFYPPEFINMRGIPAPCEDTWQQLQAKREQQEKAALIRMSVCVPHCVCSRCCGKDAFQVFECPTVKKHQAGFKL